MATVEYRKSVLHNGITLVAERHPYVRSVSLGVWVRVGSAHETPSINGISHFIEHMVFKGTETRTPLELATVLESLGGDGSRLAPGIDITNSTAEGLVRSIEICREKSLAGVVIWFYGGLVDKAAFDLLKKTVFAEAAPLPWK